jgi:adenine-specific DNA-methyltransferase
MARASRPKQVGALRHDEKRANIPTAEMQSFFQREEDHSPMPPKHYERRLPLVEGERRERDPDRDPQLLWNGMRITLTEAQRRQLVETGEIEIGESQLVWRGKDTQDWSDLVVQTPPLYIQEKIHPKAIIDDLRRRSACPMRRLRTSRAYLPISTVCQRMSRLSFTSMRRIGRTA